MRRAAFVALASAILAPACEDTTPKPRLCPTKAQAVHFSVSGPCGSPGTIDVYTDPGFCDVTAQGAAGVGLPTEGYFSGTASLTNYDLTLGGFTLHRGSSDPQADPSSITCQCTQEGGSRGLTLECDINDCLPSGEGEGYSCQLTTCTDHLESLL